MAFGDRKVRYVSPTCEDEGCDKPEYLHGLCWPHWAAQTDLERHVRSWEHAVPEPDPATTNMDEFEALL